MTESEEIIRNARAALKNGEITQQQYEDVISATLSAMLGDTTQPEIER